jgi:hypothetical protein
MKLESTAKANKESTKTELEEFHKQLSKELEQYRSAINKTVLPVAKALEGKTPIPQAKEAPSKQQGVPSKVQEALVNAQAKMQNLLILALLASIASAIFSVVNLMSKTH